jgi:hypothetical protein
LADSSASLIEVGTDEGKGEGEGPTKGDEEGEAVGEAVGELGLPLPLLSGASSRMVLFELPKKK